MRWRRYIVDTGFGKEDEGTTRRLLEILHPWWWLVRLPGEQKDGTHKLLVYSRHASEPIAKLLHADSAAHTAPQPASDSSTGLVE